MTASISEVCIEWLLAKFYSVKAIDPWWECIKVQ